MPFKKPGARASLQPIDARKIFIGRNNELHFFIHDILEPDEPTHNIVSISGQGGVGKSTLVNRFSDEAHATNFKDYCFTALVNERQITPTSIMERFAEQLHIEGDFKKALGQYKETVYKLRSEREAMRDVFPSTLAYSRPTPMVKLIQPPTLLITFCAGYLSRTKSSVASPSTPPSSPCPLTKMISPLSIILNKSAMHSSHG